MHQVYTIAFSLIVCVGNLMMAEMCSRVADTIGFESRTCTQPVGIHRRDPSGWSGFLAIVPVLSPHLLSCWHQQQRRADGRDFIAPIPISGATRKSWRSGDPVDLCSRNVQLPAHAPDTFRISLRCCLSVMVRGVIDSFFFC